MHSIWFPRERLEQAGAAAEPPPDVLRSRQITVHECLILAMVGEPIRMSRSETSLARGEIKFRRAGARRWAAEPPAITAEVGACRGEMDEVIDGCAVGGVLEPYPRRLMVLKVSFISDGRDPLAVGRAVPGQGAADMLARQDELVPQQSV